MTDVYKSDGYETQVHPPGRKVSGNLRDIIFGALPDTTIDELRKQYSADIDDIRMAEQAARHRSSQLTGQFSEEIKI